MDYPWRCPNCKAQVTVTRRLRDYKEPPVRPCPGCGNTEGWTRVVTAPHIASTEDHQGGFPIRIPKLKREIVGIDSAGQPIVNYKDVVFTSRSQQKRWLKENNMCLTDAGDDPSIGASQHSVYDQDHSAPSARAAKMLEQAHFVEDPSTKYQFD